MSRLQYGKVPPLTKKVMGDADYNIREGERMSAKGKASKPRLVPVVVPLPGQGTPNVHAPLSAPPVPEEGEEDHFID